MSASVDTRHANGRVPVRASVPRDREGSDPSAMYLARIATITDLLEQGIPLKDVQQLAGHTDPRTTRLYDRRQKKITRNIVERISI